MFQARTTAPNRRHLFLGQTLLLGLFLLAGLSAAASLSQNPLSCAAFRLVGLPAALVFAALLVKCVFLLSLNSGVYLPAPYQVSSIRMIYHITVDLRIINHLLINLMNFLSYKLRDYHNFLDVNTYNEKYADIPCDFIVYEGNHFNRILRAYEQKTHTW